MSLPPLLLDGKKLEGGGQLLRLALSLSALTRHPVRITDIRANRGSRKPNHPAGGLKAAHLAAAEWLANATQALTDGMKKGSADLTFRPLQSSMIGDKQEVRRHLSRPESSSSKSERPFSLWQDVLENGVLVRRATHIDLDSPGSVCLILQAILPFLLFHPINGERAAGSQTNVVSQRVTIRGGTNVSKSPSIEYFSQVLVPMLVEKVHVPAITINIIKRGWSSGRADVGAVEIDVTPMKFESRLSAFSLSDRGEVIRMHVSILAPDSSARAALKDLVIAKTLNYRKDVEILFPVDEDTRNGKRLYLLMVAETSNGYRLGRDCLYDRKVTSAALDTVSTQVLEELEEELARGGCVDEYMQDQLIVFQALAAGRSFIDSGKNIHATLHTRTVRWVAEQVLGVAFDEQGACDGIGFQVGKHFAEFHKYEEEEHLEAKAKALSLSSP